MILAVELFIKITVSWLCSGDIISEEGPHKFNNAINIKSITLYHPLIKVIGNIKNTTIYYIFKNTFM